jgi:cytochrome c biogenesis protein CcmG/thiol:disulfide interchange protein DsbE
VGALALVLAIALAACGTSGSGTAKVGERAPDISATALDGTQITLAALRGRPVIVNFWGSWCVPCRQEMPRLKSLLERHASEGLAIVGVLYKDDADPARAFVASFGGTWPNVLDPDGAIARAYRVVGAPQSYFIDRQGVLRSIQVGEILDVDFDHQYPAIVK